MLVPARRLIRINALDNLPSAAFMFLAPALGGRPYGWHDDSPRLL